LASFAYFEGTDEHGQKIQNAAKAKNVSEIEHCDIYANRFKDLAASFDVNYDVFIRTTEGKRILYINIF